LHDDLHSRDTFEFVLDQVQQKGAIVHQTKGAVQIAVINQAETAEGGWEFWMLISTRDMPDLGAEAEIQTKNYSLKTVGGLPAQGAAGTFL